jgi:glycosyltransferase involved in cell wall biosynthesis
VPSILRAKMSERPPLGASLAGDRHTNGDARLDARDSLRSTGIGRLLRNTGLAALRLEGRARALRNRASGSQERPLRIVACTPTYLPGHRRGAEVTLHAVLTALHRRGHEIKVLVDEGDGPVTVDGIKVIVGADRAHTRRHGEWADIVVGQLAGRWPALCLAARSNRPSVYFMHVGNVSRRVLYGNPDLTVFNSELLCHEYAWIAHPLVVHPPIPEMDYLTSPGDAITLVNLTEPKGAEIFYELARRLPDCRFLGVKGTGPQLIPDPVPANVTILDQVPEMREVYRRTRILLVPSVYESYGRVALEAAVSGIPTIAHPTPGMREAMGDAALWTDRNDVDAWVDRISRMDDSVEYARASRLARARFEMLDPETEIDALEQALLELRPGRAT